MSEIWPIVFLGIVLKIPVFFGLWLVWWASRQYDEEFDQEAPPSAEDHGFRRWRREPKRPTGPRRGPNHGGGAVVVPDSRHGGRLRGAAPRRTAPGRPAQTRR